MEFAEFDPSSMTDDCYHLLIMSLCYRDREATRRSLESKLEAIDIERASVLMQINTLEQEISIRKENLQGMLFSFPKKETLCAATDRKTGSLRQQISSSSPEVDTSCRKYMLKSLYVGRTSRETYSDIFNIFHDSQCSMLCVDGDASGIVDVTEVMSDSYGWFPCYLCHDKVVLSSFLSFK